MGDTYRIYRAGNEALLYEECPDRVLRFYCRPTGEPPHVSVPGYERWADQTPPWAHELRGVIVSRLRAARCILYEEADGVTTIAFPDARFRVEAYSQQDERGSQPFIRIVSADGREIVPSLPDAWLHDRIEFPGVGLADIPFTRAGQRQRVRIDVAAGTLSVLGIGSAQRLDYHNPLHASTKQKPRWRVLLSAVASLVSCAFLVAGSLWIAFEGKTFKDQFLGVFGTLFFILCGAAPVVELRRLRSPRFVRREDPFP